MIYSSGDKNIIKTKRDSDFNVKYVRVKISSQTGWPTQLAAATVASFNDFNETWPLFGQKLFKMQLCTQSGNDNFINQSISNHADAGKQI